MAPKILVGPMKLTDNSTLVPKHVVVGICYEVCFVMFYCILISEFCCFKKCGI